METKIFRDCEVKAADDEQLILEHFISTVTEDDGGDIMEPKGMSIRGRPVVLFQHGYDMAKGSEPIAKVLGISIGTNSKGVEGLIARTQFFPDDQGKRLYKKAKEGYMPNWSIGYKVDDYRATAKGGRHVVKWQLMEYSQVAVGMNSEATVEPDAKLFTGVKLECCKKCVGCEKCKGHPEVVKTEKCSDGGRSRKRAHKILKAVHNQMISDMQEAASADTFIVDGAEKSAKTAVEDFTESAKGHIGSYIKAVQGMDGNEEFETEKPDEEGDDTKGYQKCKNALRNVRDELIKTIRSYKCNQEVNPDEEAEKCSTAHAEKALPYAVEFVKEYAKKCAEDRRKKAEAEKAIKQFKTIAERIIGDNAERTFYDKIYHVHNALIQELLRLATETTDDTGAIVKTLLDEYVGIISPAMVSFANECRMNETLKDKYKMLIEQAIEGKAAAVPAAPPVPPAAIDNPPPAQEKFLHVAAEPSFMVPSREELEQAAQTSFGKALGDELTRAVRKLQGKLD